MGTSFLLNIAPRNGKKTCGRSVGLHWQIVVSQSQKQNATENQSRPNEKYRPLRVSEKTSTAGKF